MPKRNTIVVPCIEKISLYACGESSPMPGLMSCVRMSIAKITAMRKNTSAVPMYMRPIFLWSVVVSQAPRPPRSAACSAAAPCGGAGRLEPGRDDDVAHLSSSR